MSYWLPGAVHHDLSDIRGNGPFSNFLGVVLHVNVDENGTSDSFYGGGSSVNPMSVCPNFQVMKSAAAGGIHQLLPLDWQPWTQISGNFNYASIETAGMPDEPLTDYQVQACAQILTAYHEQMGMVLTLAESPGQHGFGTHAMGGQAWGGHPCPGPIRAGQRQAILNLVTNPTSGDEMSSTEYTQVMAALAKEHAEMNERELDKNARLQRLNTELNSVEARLAKLEKE